MFQKYLDICQIFVYIFFMLMSITEWAKKTGISRQRAHQLRIAGLIFCQRIGHIWAIDSDIPRPICKKTGRHKKIILK